MSRLRMGRSITSRRSGPSSTSRIKAVVASMLLSASVATSTTAAPAAVPRGEVAAEAPGTGLTKDDRALIALAAAEGRDVTLVIVSEPGRNRHVAGELRARGASVDHTDDDVDYIRARVAPERASAVADTPGIVAAAVDRLMKEPPDPTPPAPGARSLAPTAGPGPTTPAVNPFLPTGDIGAPQFVSANPTFDGRGVTIGIVDDGIDLLTPELGTARLADGTIVPKVVDFVTSNDPYFPWAEDPTWVDMSAQVTASGGTIGFAGRTYTAPADGGFRMGVFDERDPALFEIGNDVDRDGNPPGSAGLFAVLWEAESNQVWVDTDRDLSFADEAAMTDYAVDYDVGVFGLDDPATPVRESIPFVVQTDPRRKLVNVNMALGRHGTAVASVAAGKGFFGGAFDGAAPEARVAMVRTNFWVSSSIEGILHLVKHDHADVVSLSFGGFDAFATSTGAHAVYSTVVDRVTELFGTQVFASAGNEGTTLESVGSPAATGGVVAVGGTATPESADLLAGVDLDQEGVLWFSSAGPNDDGALKPDVVAPGLSLVARPGWMASSGFTFDPGPGYGVELGTSFASPMVAGGAALILSAARQNGVAAGPAQLRQAIHSSARWLAGDGVESQGRGVVDVGRAWDVLRQRPRPVVIDTYAPVANHYSGFLSPPHTGPGLYERDGWSAGDSGQRAITLVRRTGLGKPVTYDTSWTGNDGTFSVPPSVVLARNDPTTLAVSIGPVTTGLHTAILNLDDPSGPGIEHQLAVTVVVPHRFVDSNQFRVTTSRTLAANKPVREFFQMPQEFVLSLRSLVVEGGEGRFATFADPTGRVSIPGMPAWFGVVEQRWPDVIPGVWELDVVGPAGPLTLETTVLAGVEVAPSPVVFDPAPVGITQGATLDFTATPFGFRGRAEGTNLGPLMGGRSSLGDGDFTVQEILVEAGTSELAARIDHPSDPSADLDLYLYDCTFTLIPFCIPWATGTSVGATEQVVWPNPTPGRWVLVTDAYYVPQGTAVEFDSAWVATAPSWGSVDFDDATSYHGPGQTWSRSFTVTPGAAPPDGDLVGLVSVEAAGTWLWGGAQVELRNVTGP